MKAFRARHVSVPTERQAENRHEIVRDKGGGREEIEQKWEAAKDRCRRGELC